MEKPWDLELLLRLLNWLFRSFRSLLRSIRRHFQSPAERDRADEEQKQKAALEAKRREERLSTEWILNNPPLSWFSQAFIGLVAGVLLGLVSAMILFLLLFPEPIYDKWFELQLALPGSVIGGFIGGFIGGSIGGDRSPYSGRRGQVRGAAIGGAIGGVILGCGCSYTLFVLSYM
jgi:hypothetical protein